MVTYIDNRLASEDGFPEKTYRHPPYAQVYEGDSPPQQEGGYQVIWVSKDDVERYGYQSVLTPGEVYRVGVSAVNRYSNSRFGKDFVELTEQQQDTIVGDLAEGRAEGFDHPALSAQAFFNNLRRHTAEGMFSDPLYGGNRDMVGWKLVGYPGAQRGYTPRDMRTEGTRLDPQSLAQLHPFNPGQPARPEVVLPVSGSSGHDHE